MFKIAPSKLSRLKFVSCLGLFVFQTSAVLAQTSNLTETPPPFLLSESDFGGVGLWQTPTARFKPDGQLDVVISHIFPYTRGNIVFQPLPWIEAIARYSDISNVAYTASTTDQSNKDKSLDVKFRLLQEGFYWPAMAVGFRDFGGTALFSSEYINASKRFGPLDLTIGIAWGNMAGGGLRGIQGNIYNPMCKISENFCSRTHSTGMGGTIGFGNFFSGRRASLFGGIEYQTPYSPLRLKLEYDPNKYNLEAAQYNQPLPIRSHWNIGAVYKLWRYFDLSVAFERGNRLMLGIDFSTNFHSSMPVPKVDREPIALTHKRSQKQNWPIVVKSLREYGGFNPTAIYKQDEHLIVTGQQKKYLSDQMSLDRVSRVLYNLTSINNQSFTVINQHYGMLYDDATTTRASIDEFDEDRLIPFNEETIAHQSPQEDPSYQPDFDSLKQPLWHASPSRWRYIFQPKLQQNYGGSEAFMLYRFMLNGFVQYQLNESLVLTGGLGYDLFNNLDNVTYLRPTNVAPLPRVRSFIKNYLIASRLNINRLQFNYFHQLNYQWFGQVYGGYLEQMFAGVGGEVLFKPNNAKLAIGLDINRVQQRGFDMGFSLLPYKVTTGHLTAYYQWPIYNILSKVSVGRYLAGDQGVTIDLSRQFSSGVTFGGFATFTNVSARQFGEGSFNKGFYLKIPFDLMSIKSSTRVASFNWTPLTRDGGQMLAKQGLYDLTNRY